MKNRTLFLLFLLLALPCLSFADNFVNLTPYPRTMSQVTGELVLPQQFMVSTNGLSPEMSAEAEKFVKAFNEATGYQATLSTENTAALFTVKESNSQLKEEGYRVNITEEGVYIEASTPIGLYYAFQTIKKILPPNVMAGVKDATVTQYTLPLIKLDDSPTYGYRGFMLDTSRHFFSVEELKRVLEVMSYYKMNRFHWHMTDDQGWRVEIKKYPRLTAVGSVSDNSYMVDMHHGDYWLNQTYGPYFYTQEQVKEVVAYAKERHIEIVPEIDMPGHFCAAMAAYPEFSCTPNGSHQVITNIGGVYNDVLNVANPAAVQFAKDILTEIMELFPGEYIHIGGDECPTTAWENNAECIAKKNELGLKSFRELQSHFIKDMADHLKAHGRKISVWNEAISAKGADTRTIKETGATVYCWVGADGAAAKASSLGLGHIYTPQVPWYINRRQSNDPNEPVGAGNGNDNLEVVYKQNIPVNNAKYFEGVQATFWSEYVAFGNYLEYLMLPRLVAIAEAGWTPKNRMNFNHFCKRITADSKLYDYNNYQYGKHYMKSADNDEKVMPKVSTTEKTYWYRLVTQAVGERKGKCIELLSATSPLLNTYKNKGAEKGRLWTNAQVGETDAAYDYQFWALEENATQPGHYALVCKAFPNGSLSATPTAKNNGGRWVYDEQQKHYNFVLADNGYGKAGDHYYYSIRCDQVEGLWLNAALGGQGYAVNLYNKPDDGNGGLWLFVPQTPIADTGSLQALIDEAKSYLAQVKTYASAAEKRPGYFGAKETSVLQELVVKDLSALNAEELSAFTTQLKEAYTNFHQSFGYLEKDKIYTLTNAVMGFEQLSIHDTNKGSNLRHTHNIWTDNAWIVTESTIHEDFTQSVKMQNVQTRRFIGNLAKNAIAKYGFAVNTGRQGAQLLCTFQPGTQDYILSVNGKNLYPVGETSTTLPGTICAGSDARSGNAIRPQGAAWNIVESRVVTFDCYDQNDQSLGLYRRSFPVHADEAELVPPTIKNHTFVAKEGEKYIYKRSAFEVREICRDQFGALISVVEKTCGVEEDYQFVQPEIPFYTFVKADCKEGESVKLTDDTTINIDYTTTAINGVKRLGDAVSEVKANCSYVIYDTSPSDAARRGYRNANAEQQVMRNLFIDDTTPNHTWILESVGKNFKIKNMQYESYVPLLKNSTPATLSKQPGVFSLSLNADGETWKIKGSNGVCWDGLGSGALVGWNDPGHPYKIYEYYAQPYFRVTIQTEDVAGKTLAPAKEVLVKAGEKYTLVTENLENYTLKEIQGGEALQAVSDHVTVKVVYEDDSQTGIEAIEAEKKAEGIYDLSGRRLQRIGHKGIYIINGQKVLVK